MKTTGNLGLKKPDGTDIVDIADLNGNMDILDTAIKAVQDHSTDAVKHLTAAERTVWNAKASTAAATTSVAGLMSAADKSKLDGVAAGANNYAHPTGDGNLHVPATGTTNNTKVLKAGSTAGSAAWGTVNGAEVVEDSGHRFATDTEKAVWNAKASTAAATASVAGLMSATDKSKLDGVAAGANSYVHPNHTGDVTSTGDGVTAIAPGVIVDADINSAAAILWSKISKTGASLADLQTRSATDLSSGTLAAARLPAISGDITMAAGTSTAAITAGVIVNADISAAAAIDATKIGTGVVSNAEFSYLDGVNSGIQGQIDSKLPAADYVRQPGYAADSGAANVKAVTLSPVPVAYADGMAVAFKNAVLNTGATTINVNGLGAKTIVKANGSALASGNLKAGSIYTVRYNATTGNFILQGEGGEYGTAGATDVLAGETIGTETGLVTGKIPNNGAGGTITPSGSAQTKPAGYYSSAITIAAVSVPSGSVRAGVTIAGTTGTLTVQATDVQTVTPGTANIVKPNGIYDGAITIQGDPDLITSNIRSGVSIFGVTGSMVAADSSTSAWANPPEGGVSSIDITAGINVPAGKTLCAVSVGFPLNNWISWTLAPSVEFRSRAQRMGTSTAYLSELKVGTDYLTWRVISVAYDANAGTLSVTVRASCTAGTISTQNGGINLAGSFI